MKNTEHTTLNNKIDEDTREIRELKKQLNVDNDKIDQLTTRISVRRKQLIVIKNRLSVLKDMHKAMTKELNELVHHEIYGERTIPEWIDITAGGLIAGVVAETSIFQQQKLQMYYKHQVEDDISQDNKNFWKETEKNHPELKTCQIQPNLFSKTNPDGSRNPKGFELGFYEGSHKLSTESIIKPVCMGSVSRRGSEVNECDYPEDFFEEFGEEFIGLRACSEMSDADVIDNTICGIVVALDANDHRDVTEDIYIELVDKNKVKTIIKKSIWEWKNTLIDNVKKKKSFNCARIFSENNLGERGPRPSAQPEPIPTPTEDDFINSELNAQQSVRGQFFSWMTGSMQNLYNSPIEFIKTGINDIGELAKQQFINTANILMRRQVVSNVIVVVEENLMTDYPDITRVAAQRTSQLRNIKNLSFWVGRLALSMINYGVVETFRSSAFIPLHVGLGVARVWIGTNASTGLTNALWYGEAVANILTFASMAGSIWQAYDWLSTASGGSISTLNSIFLFLGTTAFTTASANPVMAAIIGIILAGVLVYKFATHIANAALNINNSQIMSRLGGFSLNVLYPVASTIVAVVHNPGIRSLTPCDAMYFLGGTLILPIVVRYATKYSGHIWSRR